MSNFGYEDLRERKVLLDEEDDNGDTFEFTTDRENGAPELPAISTTQFGGEGDEGNQSESEVEIFGDGDRKSLIDSSAVENKDLPDIDKDGVVREYEVALKHLGFGLFHILLTFVNGIALSADAVEILSISFVLPILIRHDEFGISDTQESVLSSVIFLGMLFGSYFWGSLADIAGRRTILIISLAVSGLFGLVSAFAPTFSVFVLFRFCSGFGVGGSLPVIYPYNSEFIYNRHRGPYLGLQSVFWMFGRLFCGAFAWVLIPLGSIGASYSSIEFRSWRLFLLISALPSILGSLLYFLLPESPRYLLEVGKERKAMKVLQKVYRLNHLHKRTVMEYPVKSILLEKDPGVTAGSKYSSSRLKRLALKAKEVLKRTVDLYRLRFLRRTLLLMWIYVCLAFSAYGISVWYPTYVSIITSNEEQARFDAKCQQNVTEFDFTSFHDFCGCNNTVFQDLTISDVHLQSWSIEGAMFSNVTFHNVTFDNVVMNNSQFLNGCSFSRCSFNTTKLAHLTWSDVTVESTSLFYSAIRDLQGVNVTLTTPLLIQNTSVNEICYSEAMIVNSSILLDGDGSSDNVAGSGGNDGGGGGDGINGTCDTRTVGSQIECRKPDTFKVYRDNFFVSASSLPGSVASAIGVYFFKRNYWLAFCLLLSTVSVFLLYAIHSEVSVVIMLCLFTALSTPAWNDANLIIAEVYPTYLRATATGIHLLMARIGAIFGTLIFGAFVYVNPSIPILIVASILLLGTLAALPLPVTTRKTLLK